MSGTCDGCGAVECLCCDACGIADCVCGPVDGPLIPACLRPREECGRIRADRARERERAEKADGDAATARIAIKALRGALETVAAERHTDHCRCWAAPGPCTSLANIARKALGRTGS
jgi:hypothetical protein